MPSNEEAETSWWERWSRRFPQPKDKAVLQLLALAHDMPYQFVLCGPDESIQWVNPAFEQATGYLLTDIAGRRPAEFLPCPQSDPATRQRMHDAIAAGQAVRAEVLNQDRDGRVYWVDLDIRPLRNLQGEITGFASIQIDITERLRAEQQLWESRERFKSLLEMSSDWYWETGPDGRFTLMSDGFEATGFSQAAIMGQPVWALAKNPQDQVCALLRTTLAAQQAFNTLVFQSHMPGTAPGAPPPSTSALAPDGVWLSISGRPLHDAAGQLTGYRGIGRDVSAEHAAQQQLWNLANLDAVTRLPNRMCFHAALERAVTSDPVRQPPFALLIIDLDNFQEVNDSQGHDTGDALLAAVAQRLRAALQPQDLVARLGGDEFGVMLHDLRSPTRLSDALDALMQTMRLPIEVGGQLRQCSISLGVTLFPSDATQTVQLIKNADIALYQAKAVGRGQYVMFKPEFKTAVDRQAKLLQEVEDAMRNGGLFLQYQPVVDLALGCVVSLEALLRWHHPTRGMVSVGSFMQVFDKLGISAQLGRLVMQMALSQAAQWAHAAVPFQKIALNVTAGDFVLGAFPAALEEQLARHGVQPASISVEVTEGMFLGHTAVAVLDGLSELHSMGIEISFDDFGTGYASLMHLKLPIDRLKIDRSFVQDIGDDTPAARTNAIIVQAVMDLGRRLGKSITVEGVETAEQVELLKTLGCSQFQGHVFSAPLDAKEVPDFIRHFNRQALSARPPVSENRG